MSTKSNAGHTPTVKKKGNKSYKGVNESQSFSEDDDGIDELLLGSSPVEHIHSPRSSNGLGKKNKKNFVPLESHGDIDNEEEEANYDDEEFEQMSPRTQQYEDDLGNNEETKDENANEEELESSIAGMTLDSYMLEVTKRHQQQSEEDIENELAGIDGEKSKPMSNIGDPSGLDGVTPEPGQRRINGYNGTPQANYRFSPVQSPLNLNSFPLNNNMINLSPEAKDAISSMINKMSDVQAQLTDLNAGSGGKAKKQKELKPNNSVGHIGAIKKVKTNDIADVHISDDPPADVKIEALTKEVKRRGDLLKHANEKIEILSNKIVELETRLECAEQEIEEQKRKVNKLTKQKKKADKEIEEMAQEMKGYNQLIEAVETLRSNETALINKLNEVNENNKLLALQLKNSLSRELEWRALHSKTLVKNVESGGDDKTNGKHSSQSHDLYSHRSMPDYESEKNKKEKKKKARIQRRTADNYLPKLGRG